MSAQPNQKGNTITVFQVIRQALSGHQQDYTSGSIRRAVVLASIPMILEMCMESVFALVDIFFVGRIGKEAVATVGLTESVLAIVYSLAMGMGMAATAMVARRVGEKNEKGASQAAGQAILIQLVLTLVLSLSGALLAPKILQVMGGSPQMVATGAIYTRIVFASCVVIMLLFLINGIFRGAGNASIAMWSLWIANGCNIVLCPILIHFYGLAGAAMATAIGRGIGVCYQVFQLIKSKGPIKLIRSYFSPDKAIIRGLLKIAWTGTLQFLVATASWMIMARIIAQFHDTAIAGYQVFLRILIFFILPAWGMSNAAATLVGQNLGAGRPDRAEASVRTASFYNALFMLAVSVLFLVAAEPIVHFINHDPDVAAIATRGLRIVSLGYILYGVGMVLTNAFNGAGDTRTPTIISLFCFWTFQIPLAWLLAIYLGLGPKGVFIAILLAESSLTVVSFFLFRRGNWKKVGV